MARLAPAPTAAIFMFIDSPPEQTVPAATDMTTDQEPLAHLWKDVPPMQLNIPSEVQEPVIAPEEAVVPVPVLVGAAGEVVALALEAAEEVSAVTVVWGVALGAVWDTTVAKTPPERLTDAVAVVAGGAAVEVV